MDNHYYYSNLNYRHGNVTNNRVHINPNFNRNLIGNTAAYLQHSNVYFNPNFSHKAQQNIMQLKNEVDKPRIHVNPNFIRPTTQVQTICNNSQLVVSNSVLSSTKSNPFEKNINTQVGLTQVHKSTAVTKSRYYFVRQKENEVIETPAAKVLTTTLAAKVLTTTPIAKVQTTTVKVNKYKSVSLNAVKKNLATEKGTVRKIEVQTTINQQNQQLIKSKYRLSQKPISNVQNTRFKFVKCNPLTMLNSSQTKLRRVSLTLNKSILNTSSSAKKIVKGSLKKNNIPCPQFRKYGKCLRKYRGHCDYLHDKKHVSICRKFIKGICHDKDCLLSHDLTDKKMPTCYFYLQGNCTKEGCPYLHVKLNEKAKICQDFIKGYCEKGDKCLYRHIIGNTVSKASTSVKLSPYPYKNKRIINERVKSNVKFIKHKKDNSRGKIEKTDESSKEDSAREQRYFKDSIDNASPSELCDLIKPIRCKLGTLPSFIQL